MSCLVRLVATVHLFFFLDLETPAVFKAIATACFCLRPDFMSSLMFFPIVFLLLPFFSGMMHFPLRSARRPGRGCPPSSHSSTPTVCVWGPSEPRPTPPHRAGSC